LAFSRPGNCPTVFFDFSRDTLLLGITSYSSCHIAFFAKDVSGKDRYSLRKLAFDMDCELAYRAVELGYFTDGWQMARAIYRGFPLLGEIVLLRKGQSRDRRSVDSTNTLINFIQPSTNNLKFYNLKRWRELHLFKIYYEKKERKCPELNWMNYY
jgi:hypothetical protein